MEGERDPSESICDELTFGLFTGALAPAKRPMGWTGKLADMVIEEDFALKGANTGRETVEYALCELTCQFRELLHHEYSRATPRSRAKCEKGAFIQTWKEEREVEIQLLARGKFLLVTWSGAGTNAA